MINEVTDKNLAVPYFSYGPKNSESAIYAAQSIDVDNGDFISASKQILYAKNPENYYYGSDPNAGSLLTDYRLNGVQQDLNQSFYNIMTDTAMDSNYNFVDNRGGGTNNYITEEKNRINSQRLGSEWNRKDSFGIGTVYLNIPPTQIRINNRSNHIRYNGLRQSGEMVLTSGRYVTTIELDVTFNGLDDINNKLRPIIAQIKTTPFLPLVNEHLTNILNPFNRKAVDSNLLENLNSQLKEMQVKESIVDELMRKTNSRAFKQRTISDEVGKLENDGLIDNVLANKLRSSYISDPESIPQSELTDDCYDITPLGVKYVNISKFIKSKIVTGGGLGEGFLTPQRSLNEINRVQSEINDINSKMGELYQEGMEERFKDKPIVGVLSQMVVSTIPEFPESLQCNMSFYIFNYDPYSLDFAYISGYNNKSATTDITKCDLFIDWYSKRWLIDRNDPDKPGLAKYNGDATTVFTYATKLKPIDEHTDNKNVVESKDLIIENGIYITGISLSIRNTLPLLPILSCKNPTCQYMGTLNSDVNMTFVSTNQDKTQEMCQMVERIQSISRQENRVTRNNFVYVKNNFLDFFATPYFNINNFSIDTIPGSPGLVSIALSLISHKTGQEDFQRLKREYISNQLDIIAAARWVLEKANLYITTKSTADPQSIQSYSKYYKLAAHPQGGWITQNGGVVRDLFSDIEFGEDKNSQLKADIWASICLDSKLRYPDMTNVSYVSMYSPIVVGTFSPLEFVMIYEKNFLNSLNNDSADDYDSFFNKNKNYVAQTLAVVRRDEILELINKTWENQGLNEYLNNRKDENGNIKNKEDLDAGKDFCYPDLELPRYGELPNGFVYMNTNKSSGIPYKSGDSDKSIQTGNSQVDPDFFMYKGSLWNGLDLSTDVSSGVDQGLMAYKKLAEGNRLYKRQYALSEQDFGLWLAESQKRRINDIYATSIGRVDTNLRDELEGKSVKLVSVTSGDKIRVGHGKEVYDVKLFGYKAPELYQKNGQKVQDPTDAKIVLESYLGQPGEKDIVLWFGAGDRDSDGTLQAHVYAYSGNDSVHVNEEMIKRSKELGLAPYTNPDDPLALQDTEMFWKSHENYMHPMVKIGPLAQKLYKVKKVADVITDLGKLFNPAFWFTNVSGLTNIGGRTGKIIGNSFTTDFNKAESQSTDDLSSALSDIVSVAYKIDPKLTSAAFASDVPDSGNSLTNDLDNFDPSTGKLLYSSTNNYGLRRFDRDSEMHIDLIASKVREQQKDDILRVSRAFPTFKLYFIEEDLEEWRKYDDAYGYPAVASIDITKSRKEPADVAVLTLFNTRGTLDTSNFGLYSPDNTFLIKQPQESPKASLQETRDEQELEEFVLQPGTMIKILMGYSADPDLLETVFTGMVSEVDGGDIMTVVAQGFGVELLHKVPQYKYITESASAFKVLDRIIKSPDVRHFGRVQWFPEETATNKKLFRRPVSAHDPGDPSKMVEASMWRNIYGIRFFMGLKDDTRDNNIWAPENSWLYNMARGQYQDFITKDMTIWDIFRDMMRRMPGYITTVLPFDNRATIYFGPADFLYWYTDRKKIENKLHDMNYIDAWHKDDSEKLEDMVNSYGYEKISSNDISGDFSDVSDHINNIFNEHPEFSTSLYSITDKMEYLQNLQSLMIAPPVSPDIQQAITFLNISAQSDLSNTQKDQTIKKKLEFIASQVKSGRSGDTIKIHNMNGKIDIKYVGVDDLYINKKDGSILDPRQAIDRYNKTITTQWEETNPTRKLLRKFHFKDSYHHIIANDIVATSQYLYNRVTVEFGLESMWKNNFAKDTPSRFFKVSAQIDDEIFPERIKEKIVQEKNARDIVSAWGYALGNLWEESRKMYNGSLTILGDPSVKPYDIVMLSDYFTDMHGPVEVEQVIHHFSQETGFVTKIVPGLVCYVNNSLQKGSMIIAGNYMDEISERVSRWRNTFNMGGLVPVLSSSLGNSAANLVFWISGISTGRREPISFSPLMYAGRPFIAGVEGMRKSSLYEAIRGNVARFYLRNRRITQTVSEALDTLQIYYHEVR